MVSISYNFKVGEKEMDYTLVKSKMGLSIRVECNERQLFLELDEAIDKVLKKHRIDTSK